MVLDYATDHSGTFRKKGCLKAGAGLDRGLGIHLSERESQSEVLRRKTGQSESLVYPERAFDWDFALSAGRVREVGFRYVTETDISDLTIARRRLPPSQFLAMRN